MVGLTPLTEYEFRISAENLIGSSEFSLPSSVTTRPGLPGQIMKVHALTRGQNSITLVWTQPDSNGSPIFRYQVKTGDKVFEETSDSNTTHTVSGLNPSTNYCIQVRVRLKRLSLSGSKKSTIIKSLLGCQYLRRGTLLRTRNVSHVGVRSKEDWRIQAGAGALGI